MGEIFDQSDMRLLVSMATNEFDPDIQHLKTQYNTKIDFLLTLIRQLQAEAQQSGVVQQYYEKGQGKQFYSKITENNNQLYVKLTQIYYLMRTYLTGETISFLENIDNHLRVIEQSDWLQLLTGSHITKYGTDFRGIFLLENSLQGLGTSIEDSDKFSKIQNYDSIVEQVIEAATFRWSEDNKAPVGKYGSHDLYQKDTRDTFVYAYYTNKTHMLKLLYWGSKSYNLGWIQEEVVKRIEDSVIHKAQESYIAALQGAHPVSAVLMGWRATNVPGLVEGDLKTAQGEWVQSKRHNEQVIRTLQIHNTMIKVEKYLTELKQALSSTGANQSQIINSLTDKFYHMFSSDTEKIDTKLKEQIRSQLTLMGQPVI